MENRFLCTPDRVQNGGQKRTGTVRNDQASAARVGQNTLEHVKHTLLLHRSEQLEAENERLRLENIDLRQQANYYKSQHSRAKERIDKLKEETNQLNGTIRQLKQELFGRKSEKQSRSDRSNYLEGLEESDAEGADVEDGPPQADQPGNNKERKRRGQRRGRSGPKRRDYSHLPQRETTIELPEEERACPNCGLPLAEMSDSEEAQQIEFEFTFFRRVYRRNRYRKTCHCPGCRTITAPPPPKLIPKGLYGVSVWVEILLNKYDAYCPISRLLQQWSFCDVSLSSGTVIGGLQKLKPLFEPVYQALLEHNALGYYKQADETRWRVFEEMEGKANHRWWLWVFVSETTIVFRLDATRSHDVPEGHYPANVEGVLMVDRYSAYKAMAQVKEGTLQLAFCWAHQRRDFIRIGRSWKELHTWALTWLRRIRDLYQLNDERLEHFGPHGDADKYAQADAQLREAIAEIREQAEKELVEPKLRQPCQTALNSLLEHWDGLTLFVDDPRIPMDNNHSERTVRGPAVGRKNYYGAGSQWSGELAAMLFSIFATLKKCGINPRLWLQWFLQSCAEAGGTAPETIEPFLPWNLSEEQRQRLSLETTRQPVNVSENAKELIDSS